MQQRLTLPTRKVEKFNELRGVVSTVNVEDRPYRVIENQFSERKGIYEDIKEPLTDMEILLAGGVEVFWDSNDKRIEENWPWTGEDKRTRKAAPKKKAPAKKKASKKKASKKK